MGAHLDGAFRWVEVGRVGSVVGGGEGDKGGAPLSAVEVLEVVTADESAHAESDDLDGLVGSEMGVDIFFELEGEWFEATAAIAGFEAGCIAIKPLLGQLAFQRVEGDPRIEEAVD